MAGVIQKPDSLSLSGNIKKFILSGNQPISFVLKKEDTVLLESEYIPGTDNLLEIDIRDVVESCLSYKLDASSDCHIQTDLVASFTTIIDGTDYFFRVIRGGVSNLADTAFNWLKLHFLTWQPRIKPVTYYSPEWLTYYAVEECSIQLKATYPDKTTRVIVLHNCSASTAVTLNMQYAIITGKLGSTYPSYYEVWAETPGGAKLSESQIYTFSDPLSEDEQWYLFENSLGGLDTFRASGTNNLNAEHEYNIAEFGGVKEEYQVDTERKYTKNTGYLDEYSRRWLMDFFPSRAKYVYEATAIRKIVVTESNVTYVSSDLPSSYTFTWQLAEVSPFLNLIKNESDIPDNLIVPDLSSPDFIIPPRLAEYPRVELTEGVLIPAFDPFNPKPGVTSFGAIHDTIKNSVVKELEEMLPGPGGGGGTDIEIIESTDTTTVPTEKNVYAALKSKLEDEKRLRKDIEDTAAELLNLLKGFKAGEFIPGILTGKGGMIDGDGNGELESLIIRRFLEVPEIRFNRVEVFTGVKWNAPGGGIIESVDVVNRIAKLKLEDGEFGAIAVGDICMGIFHSLTPSENATTDTDDSKGVFTFSGFYTAYFTATEILNNENGTFKYQLRPSSASYPHEFPPCEAMHFVAYANFVNKDRQTSNYSTRSYTRYLYHADGWEFEKRQIAAQFGDLTNLSVHGYNMTGYSIFLNNIYMTGVINQMSSDGTSVERVPFIKGDWKPGKYYYYDEITHKGSTWLCVNLDGTILEPAGGVADWFKRVSKGEDGKDGISAEGVGEWLSTRDYKKSNIVRSEEASYIALRDNTGVKPIKHPGGYLMSGGSYLTTGGKRLYTGDPNHPWSLLSEDGKIGAQGIPGEKAIQYYTWLKYADTEAGAGMSNDPAGKAYMGIAVNQTIQQESTDPLLYKWSLTKGNQGIPGTPGADGKVRYTWVKYATSATGDNLSDDPTGRDYIGFAYNKDAQLEGTNPADYIWSKYKGDQGIPGLPGKDAIQYYTWLKYADTEAGAGMSELPAGKKYMGLTVNNTSPIESDNPADYKWALIEGKGVPGNPGIDGKTLYTWVKYATSITGDNISDDPSGRDYVGFAYNKDTAEESNNKADYKWSKLKGDPGEAGLNYILDPYSVTRQYRQRDLISFAGGKIFCKKDNIGQTPVPFLSSGGKYLTTGGSYLLYKPLTATTINSEYWDIFIPPTVIEPVEREFTTYHPSTTKPSRPILTGNSTGWSQTIMTGARWKSTKKAISDADGTWSDPVQYSAEDGKPGTDATAYWLVSPVTNIVFNSIGTPTPSGFTVSSKQQTGIASVQACDKYYLVVRKSVTGTTWEQHVAPIKGPSVNVTVIAGIKFYAIRSYEKQADALAWSSNYTDEVGVSVIRDGVNGERGATGSMPRNCGFFDVNKVPFFWNAMYRDIVLHPFGNIIYIFQVRNYNPDQGISVPPTSQNGDDYWEPANKMGFVAMDTALIDGAVIADFIFKNRILQSSLQDNGKSVLSLDGNKGIISLQKGGVSIRLNPTGDVAVMELLYNGVKKLEIAYDKTTTATGATTISPCIKMYDGADTVEYSPRGIYFGNGGFSLFSHYNSAQITAKLPSSGTPTLPGSGVLYKDSNGFVKSW